MTYFVGGAFGLPWARDSAKLATHWSQIKICVMTAKVLGSRTGYSAPKSTRRLVLLQNQHLNQAGSGGGSAMISGFSSSSVRGMPLHPAGRRRRRCREADRFLLPPATSDHLKAMDRREAACPR